MEIKYKWKIILNWIVEIGCEGVDWIHMIQDDYWQTCEHSNEPLFHKRQNISSLAD
jgi:hypothetical protein